MSVTSTLTFSLDECQSKSFEKMKYAIFSNFQDY